jgi:hypothetical protein
VQQPFRLAAAVCGSRPRSAQLLRAATLTAPPRPARGGQFFRGFTEPILLQLSLNMRRIMWVNL